MAKEKASRDNKGFKMSELWGEFKGEGQGKRFHPYIFVRLIPDFSFEQKDFESIHAAFDFLKKQISSLPNQYISGLELNHSFLINKVEYEKTKDSALAITTFVESYRAGIYPPMWVLSCLYEVFNDWYKLEGKKSLDELFEINLSKGSRITTLVNRNYEKRNNELCKMIFILREIFKLSYEEAYSATASYYNDNSKYPGEIESSNSDKKDREQLSPRRLKDIYKEHRKQIEENPYLKLNLQKWNDKDKTDFLKKFSRDTLPMKRIHRFKRYL